jgi:hypothetical protein
MKWGIMVSNLIVILLSAVSLISGDTMINGVRILRASLILCVGSIAFTCFYLYDKRQETAYQELDNRVGHDVSIADGTEFRKF